MPRPLDLIAYYFSGTGNSWRLAEAAANRCRTDGGSAMAWSIERGLHPDHGQARNHGFFFPVYAFGLPAIMRRFIKSLPPADGRPALVVVALGDIRPPPYWLPGYEGNALYQARALLKKRGYKLISDASAHAPENWVLVGNTPSPEVATAILQHGTSHTSSSWSRHATGQMVRKKTLILWRLLLAPIYFLWLQFGRRFTGKSFDADERCNACGQCVRHCPAGTIILKRGRPRWGWKCENCMRCLGLCPQSAIQVSWLLLGLYSVLLWPTDKIRIHLTENAHLDLAWLPPGVEWAVVAFCDLLIWAGLSVVVDRLLHELSRSSYFRWLLQRTHYTRNLRRYMAWEFPLALASGEAVSGREEGEEQEARHRGRN